MKAAFGPKPAFSILLVDDDQGARDVTCLMIRTRFPACTVYTAQDGIKGVKLFKEHSPDIVITDVEMPAMDGLEMAKEIKTVKDTLAQFIVLTAHGKDIQLNKFRELGCNTFIAKPVDFEELFATITTCLDTVSRRR